MIVLLVIFYLTDPTNDSFLKYQEYPTMEECTDAGVKILSELNKDGHNFSGFCIRGTK